MARVFISHSSRDNAEAETLFAWLKGQGFEQGFLDIDKHQGIPAGVRWEQTLYDELERAQAVVLLLTKNWFESKWCFAEFAQARSRGKAIFPVVVGPDGDEFIGDDLQKLDLTQDRDGGLERLATRLTEVALLSQGGFVFPAGRAPYPGFLAFDEADAAVYFGRDDDIRQLIQRLDSRRIEGGRRFVLVLGESGTGKSSLLRAGLVPRLRRAKREWITLSPFRPEADPFEGLALSLAEAGYQISAADLPDANPNAIARALADADGARRAGILIAVDQAEELLTRTSPDLRERFLTFLSGLLAPGLPFVAVATLRSDHLGDIQTAEGLTVEFEDFSLRPMPIERIGDIVLGPARIAGLEVEPELVARITADAKTADALPLVAYALRRLYDRFGGDNKIRLVEYESLRDAKEDLSPLETIVRDTAAEVIAEAKPTRSELTALREAFVPGLVRVNDEGGFLRQAARWDDLPEASRRLVAALAGPQARLLAIREHIGIRQVEVAHEALFRVWPLLAEWLEDEEEFLIGRNRLEKALADWRRLAEEDRNKGLIAGILLDRAMKWLETHPDRFSDDEATFIRTADAAEKTHQRQADEQRRALEEAQLRRAETERNSARQREEAAQRETRRTRVTAAFLGLALLVVAGFWVRANWAEDEALRQATIAEEQRQVAETEAERANREAEAAKAARTEAELQAQRAITEAGHAEAARKKAEKETARANREANRANEQTAAAEVARAKSNDEATRADAARTEAEAARVDAEKARVTAEKEAKRATEEADRANHNFTIASDAVYRMVFGTAAFLRDIEGVRVDEMEELLLVAERAADGLLETDPDVVSVKVISATILNEKGRNYSAAGDYSDALVTLEKSLKAYREILESAPLDPVSQHNVAFTVGLIGHVKLLNDDSTGALEAFQNSLEAFTELAKIDKSTDVAHQIAIAHLRIGDAKRGNGELDAAASAYEKCIVVLQDLNGSPEEEEEWQSSVSYALNGWALTLARRGRFEDAVEKFEQALEISERAVEARPNDSEDRRILGYILDSFADLKLANDDEAGALATYERSLAERQRLALSGPARIPWHVDLAHTWERIGETNQRLNNDAEALEAFEEALAVRRRIAALDPGPDRQRDIAWTLDRIGEAELRVDDAEKAVAAYEEALTIRRRLAEDDPGPDRQQDIAWTLDRIGEARIKAGDEVGGLEAGEESLAIRRRIAEAHPGNTGWQRDVAYYLQRLGDDKRFAGDAAGAQDAYEEGIAIRKALAEVESGDFQLQMDVAASLRWYAMTIDDSGRRRELYDEGLAILTNLKAQGFRHSDLQFLIDMLQAAIEHLEANGETNSVIAE